MATRPKDDVSEIMTVEQVAAYLQLNKLTIYKHVRAGRIPASRVGKAYRIRKADVDWFLESHKLRPARSGARPGREDLRISSGLTISPVKHSDEIAVGPRRPETADARHRTDVSLNPMEWVIRGLH